MRTPGWGQVLFVNGASVAGTKPPWRSASGKPCQAGPAREDRAAAADNGPRFHSTPFQGGHPTDWLIGIVRRSRSGGSAAARGSRARLGAYKLVASAQAYPEVSDEVRRAAGSTHEQHSGNCSGELATLLLPDKDNHEIEADQITAPGAQQRRCALADCGRSVPSRASSSGGAAVSARRAQRTPAASADDVRIAPVRRRTTGSHQKDAIAAATDHQVRTAISGRELHDDETAFAELSHYGLP